MKYRRLLLGGFLAMGLAVTTASGALAEQIVAVNSSVESVGGQATKVTDAGQNAADTSQLFSQYRYDPECSRQHPDRYCPEYRGFCCKTRSGIHHPDSYRYQHLYQQTSEQADPDAE